MMTIEGSAENDVTREAETAEPGEEHEHEEEDPHAHMNWYALHTYSSYESKVKQTIEHRVTLEGLREKVGQVVIPTEMVVEIKGGKKRTTQRTLMPGYVLIQMEPEEEIFNLVRNVKGVSGFVPTGHEPAPLTKEEVSNLLDIMEDKHEKPKPKMLYRKGDQIKVIEGPFANFIGTVEEVDEEKGKLKVMVSIFGRPTPVDLDVLQVEVT